MIRCLLFVAFMAFGLGNLRAGTLAQFRTIYGDIEVELYDNEKPKTVANFKRLTEAGNYQNTFFHRLVPGFVVQGGGFSTAAKTLPYYFAPPWYWLGSVPNFGAISNEYAVGPILSNTNRTIAMAKLSGDPHSATSQWFFNLANNTQLDSMNGGFTVFGKVVRDANNVLGFLNSRTPYTNWVNLAVYFPTDPAATTYFTELPVTYVGNVPPGYPELIYVDVSLLSVQITNVSNQKRISWNSINGKTNLVEFSTNMPPVWRSLVATNGNGSRITVIDPTATNKFRFYRVRILY
jgi:cyclophilin family peptidyl-prolyl cis-trans isomerase